MWRQAWLRIVAGFTVVLVASTLIGLAPASAKTATRSTACAQDSTDKTAPGLRNPRCINGVYVRARGWGFTQACFKLAYGPKLIPLYRVRKDACTPSSKVIQQEKIAQARFLQWQSIQAAPGLNVGEIDPGVQWEVSEYNRRQRMDAITYTPDQNPATTPVNVFELKGDWNGGVAAATPQVMGYVASLQANYGWQARLGATSFNDYFEIVEDTCDDGTDRMVYKFHSYQPAGSAGVILVEREKWQRQCEEQNQPLVKVEESQTAKELQGAPPVPASGPALLSDANQGVSVGAAASASGVHSENKPVGVPGLGDGGIPWWVALAAGAAITDKGVKYAIKPGMAAWAMAKEEVCVTLSGIPAPRLVSTGPIHDQCAAATTAPAMLSSPLVVAYLVANPGDNYVWDALRREGIIEVVQDPSAISVSTPAQVTGDPHLVTLDGLNYDLQAVGEFTLLAVPDTDLEVQARFTPVGTTQSSIAALAFDLDTDGVELRADGTVLIAGQSQTIVDEHGYFTDTGASIHRTGTRYVVAWTLQDGGYLRLGWDTRFGFGALSVDISPGVHTVGLLGNNNGEPLDDLITRQGDALSATVGPTVLHDSYADSWRIDDARSLFTYAAGQSTATFTDRGFPSQFVTRGDFTEEQQTFAAEVCAQQGVQPGPGFDDCQLDVLVTGNWQFAATAAHRHRASGCSR